MPFVAGIFDWTNNISAGSLLIWITIILGFLSLRSKLYTTEKDRREQVEQVLAKERKENLERLKAEQLEHERERDLRHELKTELANAQLRGDLTPVLEGFQSMQQSSDVRVRAAIEEISRTVREEFAKHETRAAERHDASVRVLAEIAATLKAA